MSSLVDVGGVGSEAAIEELPIAPEDARGPEAGNGGPEASPGESCGRRALRRMQLSRAVLYQPESTALTAVFICYRAIDDIAAVRCLRQGCVCR